MAKSKYDKYIIREPVNKGFQVERLDKPIIFLEIMLSDEYKKTVVKE